MEKKGLNQKYGYGDTQLLVLLEKERMCILLIQKTSQKKEAGFVHFKFTEPLSQIYAPRPRRHDPYGKGERGEKKRKEDVSFFLVDLLLAPSCLFSSILIFFQDLVSSSLVVVQGLFFSWDK